MTSAIDPVVLDALLTQLDIFATAWSRESALRHALAIMCDVLRWPVGHAWTIGGSPATLQSSGIWHGEDGHPDLVRAMHGVEVPDLSSPGHPDGDIWSSGPIASGSPEDAALATGLTMRAALLIGRLESPVAILEFFGDSPIDEVLAPRAGKLVAGRCAAAIRSANLVQTLEQRQQLLDGIMNSTADVLAILDLNGVFLHVSNSVEAVLGYRPAELIGTNSADLLTQNLAAGPDAAEASESRGLVRSLLRRKDGSNAVIESHWAMVNDSAGAPSYVISIGRDIEAQLALERGLKDAIEAAAQADRDKSRFLSRMSHELRTPLHSVLGFAQLLDMDLDDPDHRESVARIMSSGSHLLQLIDEVLEISQLDGQEATLSVESVNIDGLTAEVVAMLSPLAAERNQLIVVSQGSGRAVRGDLQRVKQILLNLLSNALKFSPVGSTVGLDVEHTGDQVTVAVRDDGPGIPEAMRERLFTPFDRLDATADVVGSGLGLALSQRLAERMDGHIHVASKVGVGSTFTLELPAGEPIQAHASPSKSDRSIAVASRRTATIVYVEDNHTNLDLVEGIMQRAFPEANLLTTTQGRMAIELIDGHRPALVLLDLHLPDVDGIEVLRQLRASSSLHDTRVLVVTADAMPSTRREVEALGVEGFLSKPIDVAEFIATVGRLTSVNTTV